MLRCSDGSYYVGSTKDLDRRLIELDGQFRCGGSRAYEHWVLRLLGLEGDGPVDWEGDDNFVLRVADPQLPEWALYPRAIFNTLTVLVSLSVLFGVGWLLIVSAREHAS